MSFRRIIMPRAAFHAAAAALGIGLAALLAPTSAQEPVRAVVAITGVTVIDGTSPAPRSDQVVVVSGNRIVAVGPRTATAIPREARIIDARGKVLIPGLWDMHVHTAVPSGREVLALYVANGVTGVRDMAGEWKQLSDWRREIASGQLIGPRMVLSGPYLEGGDVPIPHILVRTAAEARAAVDSLARLGVDFVKVHGQLTPDAYFAAARAARQRRLPFAGHIPRGVSAREASDSGQRSLEHLINIPLPCTAAESLALRPRFPLQAFVGRCTSADLAPLFARFVANGTWIVPTLTAAVEIAILPERAVPGDSFARYIPDTLRRFVAQILQFPADIPRGADSVGRALLAKRLALVGSMHRAGVRILAGTDAPLRNSPPGFGVHEELAFLVSAGLTPFEALRAATLEPARYLDAVDSLGTIAPGRLADLVLLDANPLDDIRNTRRIAAVMVNGRLFERGALRAMLDGVANARPQRDRQH